LNLAKRDWTPEQRQTCARTGLAMPNGDFPILGREDLQDAIDNHKPSKDPEAAQAHIVGRAKSIGATDLLPSDWPDSTRMGDKFAGAVRTPWDGRLDILSNRLAKAATPEERAAVSADTVRETRDLGATLAIRKPQQAPRSYLERGSLK
jgi:hypothetical protein